MRIDTMQDLEPLVEEIQALELSIRVEQGQSEPDGILTTKKGWLDIDIEETEGSTVSDATSTDDCEYPIRTVTFGICRDSFDWGRSAALALMRETPSKVIIERTLFRDDRTATQNNLTITRETDRSTTKVNTEFGGGDTGRKDVDLEVTEGYLSEIAGIKEKKPSNNRNAILSRLKMLRNDLQMAVAALKENVEEQEVAPLAETVTP